MDEFKILGLRESKPGDKHLGSVSFAFRTDPLSGAVRVMDEYKDNAGKWQARCVAEIDAPASLTVRCLGCFVREHEGRAFLSGVPVMVPASIRDAVAEAAAEQLRQRTHVGNDA